MRPIYFIKFFKTCSCFSMFFNSFFKLKSQPTLHGKLNSFMVIENDSIVQCTFLNTLWIWIFMCHNMTLSTHCKTYHQNWKALMFIWEPKPLRWTCWGVHVSCLQFKLHIWVLTQIWDLSDCYIHFYYSISYILKIQGQSIINFW